MKSSKLLVTGLVGILGLTGPAWAETVQVHITVDDTDLVLNETTTLRVWAEVINGQPGNGLYAYAFNVLNDNLGIVDMTTIQQLGSPDPFFSNAGIEQPDGLHDVYGGDGGFFADPHRGLAGPFELLAIEIEAVAEGQVSFTPEIADSAVMLGIADGILLQTPGGSITPQFTPGPLITVIPEPATVLLLGLAGLLFSGCRPRRWCS